MPNDHIRLAIAKASRGVDLTRGRLYRVIPDPEAKEAGLIRIRDDSGEDYLYPQNFFIVVHDV